jgi:hypothetical protein
VIQVCFGARHVAILPDGSYAGKGITLVNWLFIRCSIQLFIALIKQYYCFLHGLLNVFQRIIVSKALLEFSDSRSTP